MLAVTGASGQLGRLVLEHLVDRVDPARLVALSRTPDAIRTPDAAARFADFDDPATLVRAFAGVERLLLISTGVFDPPGRRIRQHRNAIHAAARAGVRHILYTSISQAADPAHPAAVAADHRVTEAALVRSGLTYTMLRHSVYTQLILAGLHSVLASGVMLDNSGDGAISYVTRQDCAAVAATVLARGGYHGQVLDVTGPAALTGTEVAAVISRVTRVPVRFVPISDDQAATDLVVHGMSEPAARRFATIGTSVRGGYTRAVTDTVVRITGNQPVSVHEYLTEAWRYVTDADRGAPRRHGRVSSHPFTRCIRRQPRQ